MEYRETKLGYLIVMLSVQRLRLESERGVATDKTMKGIQRFASSAFLPRCNMLVLRIYGSQAIRSRVALDRARDSQRKT